MAVPGRFDPGEFNLVAVEVAASKDVVLRVGLRREDGSTIGSLDLGFLHGGERKRFEFDLRALASAERPFDQLVLLANRHDKNSPELNWTLLGIDLIDRPLERWLPTVDGPAELIELEGEARRGLGLVSGSPLHARVRIPADGRLSLAHGPAPRSSRVHGELHLTVRVDDRVVLRARPEDGWEAKRWIDEEVDLTDYAGQQVDLAFALEGPARVPAAVALSQPMLSKPQPQAASAVLITSDTHRAAYLGSAGLGVSVRTPNLDALAGRGVLFEDCFSGSNNTLPAHVSLMTGRDAASTGVANNRTRLAARARTLGEVFAEAGYVTFAATSAKHMNDPWSGLGQGFDRFDYPWRERDRYSAQTIDVALDWLEDARDRPVFLWLHVFDAHRPYEPAQEFARGYFGEGDPYDPDLPEPVWPRPGKLARVRDPAWVESLYRGEVSQLDGELARLLDHDRVRRGVVAFTADHGEALGDQGIWWTHLGVYPAVLHVPLILAWPGAPAGRRVAGPVRQIDVATTLLEVAGLSGKALGGRDLSPTWREGKIEAAPRFALGSDGHAAAITTDGWHLVVNLENLHPEHYSIDAAMEHPVELFHLVQDPRCERDLAPTERARVDRMGRALLRWLEDAEAGLSERNPIDPDQEAMLAGLGYASQDSQESGLIDLEQVRARLEPWLAH